MNCPQYSQPPISSISRSQSPWWSKSRIDGDNSQHQAGFEGSKAFKSCVFLLRNIQGLTMGTLDQEIFICSSYSPIFFSTVNLFKLSINDGKSSIWFHDFPMKPPFIVDFPIYFRCFPHGPPIKTICLWLVFPYFL